MIESTTLYVDGVTHRLFPAFDGIEQEAQKAAEDVWEQITATYGHNEYSDPGDFAEQATERGIEVHENLCFVRQQLLGLAAAGLYHLWERLLKQFLKKELRRWRFPDALYSAIERADFACLRNMFMQFGFSIETFSHYCDLNELRLVANVVKHGDGKSCRELHAASPRLFEGVDYRLDISSVADTLELKAADFAKYAEAVLAFWRIFPENLCLPKDEIVI